jgi:hypothetical protein
MRRKRTLTDETATIYYNIIVRGYPNFFGYETEMRGQEEGLMKVGPALGCLIVLRGWHNVEGDKPLELSSRPP